jgi:hypothetical protein
MGIREDILTTGRLFHYLQAGLKFSSLQIEYQK